MSFLQKAIASQQPTISSFTDPRDELTNYLKDPIIPYESLQDIIKWWGVSFFTVSFIL